MQTEVAIQEEWGELPAAGGCARRAELRRRLPGERERELGRQVVAMRKLPGVGILRLCGDGQVRAVFADGAALRLTVDDAVADYRPPPHDPDRASEQYALAARGFRRVESRAIQ